MNKWAGVFPQRFRIPALLMVTGVITTLVTAVLFIQPSDGENQAERLAIYWSRYVGLALDAGVSMPALEVQLRQDAGAYPLESGFRLTVTDRTGSTIAAYAGMEAPPRYSAAKPYLAGGVPAGTVRAETAAGAAPAVWLRSLGAGAAAALLAAAALWLQRQAWRALLGRWADRAEAVTARSAHALETAESERPLPEEERLARSLAEASKLIGQLQTARQTMVAEVAHELRTPLSVLRVAMDNALYENQPLAPDRLAVLSEQIAAMSRLVQDLQDLSLAENGTLQLDKSWYEPAATAAHIAELLGPEAEEKGIDILLSLDSNVRLYGDERRIRQLLLNLLGNALRHARTRIDLTVAASDGSVIFTVKDDGWGIEAEEAEQLFQRYYRKRTYADGSPAPRGIGLGLAVVKGIAEAHGGTARVASRFGEGAVFTVELPLFRE
ncbi:MAG: two-component system sensor histidine kinase [Paenibacillaceae bacterium]|jgi:signal transduction histidine kinase|nr:two-component system sensor histidine kinase [Paenibacillaceae bacterium]